MFSKIDRFTGSYSTGIIPGTSGAIAALHKSGSCRKAFDDLQNVKGLEWEPHIHA
jgi:hypothetical protein